MSSVDLVELMQENVLSLNPYLVEKTECKIKLHANENPFPPSRELLDVFSKSLQKLQLNRYPDPDSKKLKDSIANQLVTEVERLVIGNGSDEIILFILQVFCKEGDTIIFPDPTFAMYSIISKGLGIKSASISLDSEWDFSADLLLRSANENNSKVIFISYPNNPTGNCFSDIEIQKVIENFKGIVVIDEAYHDFSQKTFINQIKKHNNLVILRSLSKIGLAGLRVGFGVADPIIINEINKIRLPYNSNVISQTFTEHLLKNFKLVQKQINSILDERNRLLKELQKIESVTPFPSDSNFILFKTERPAENIFTYLIENEILVRNLSSHPKLNNCLRVTVGAKNENDLFLSKLKDFINQ